jgi:hypothetical protein
MVAPSGREKIKDEIEAKCRNGYKYWRIGLTHNLCLAREHADAANQGITDWTSWTATSLPEARKVEQHFADKGMQCMTTEDLSISRTVHIYLFWLDPNSSG